MSDAPAAPAATQIVAVAPAKVSWRDWLPVITLMLAVGGIIMASGSYVAQLKDNTRRIDALERKEADLTRRMTDMEVKFARIEAKLDLLLERVPAGAGR